MLPKQRKSLLLLLLLLVGKSCFLLDHSLLAVCQAGIIQALPWLIMAGV